MFDKIGAIYFAASFLINYFMWIYLYIAIGVIFGEQSVQSSFLSSFGFARKNSILLLLFDSTILKPNFNLVNYI